MIGRALLALLRFVRFSVLGAALLLVASVFWTAWKLSEFVLDLVALGVEISARFASLFHKRRVRQ